MKIVPVSTALAVVVTAAGQARAQPAAPPEQPDSFDALLEPAEVPAPGEPAPATAPPPVAGPAPAAARSMNPDMSVLLAVAAAAFSDQADAESHQTGAHDPEENGFNLQQLELSLAAAVDPYFRFDANIVFSLSGVELEEAYATTLDLGGRAQLRFGQMLTRFGRINSTHAHGWDFVDQPFQFGRVFGAEGNRGLGVELSYLTPLPWYAELVASVTPADGEGTARSFFGADDLGVESPLDLLYVAALKQFFPFSDDWSCAFGVSGASGPNATGRSNRSEVYGVDLYLKYRPISRGSTSFVTLQSEWLYRRRQVPEDVLQDVGGYAQLVYRFARRFSVAGRFEYGSPAYGQDGNVAVDYLDPEWVDARTRIAASITHYPTEFSRLRLQGSRDAGLGDRLWAAFLAAEVVVGAHGAHPF